MDLLRQLEKSLECPCCLEAPKPGTTTVGMCFSGHITCHPCAIQVLNRNAACPSCRHPSFQIVRGHKLAVSVITIMTNFLVYVCKHPNCQQQVLGSNLLKHQDTCSQKPLLCPKPACAYWGPLHQFMNGHHSRCVTICSLAEVTQWWHFVIDLNHIYSVDDNEVKISSRFKPILLKGVTSNGFTSHAYISVEKLNGLAVIYCGWLNEKKHADEKYQNLSVNITSFINTPHGKVGQLSCRKPIFQFENVENAEDGVYINSETLLRWMNWSVDYKCQECGQSKGTPHLHVQVSFK